MTDSEHRPQRRTRFILPAIILLGALAAAAWHIRSETWPCGKYESGSGCISSVQLEVAPLGLESI